MAFGSLVPGMASMPIPQMKNTGLGQQGAQLLQMARGAQGQGQPGGGQQGLLARLTGGGAPGAPMDLAAPGMPPNAGPPGGNPMQMGLLGKLFGGMQGGLGGMMGGGAGAPAMPAGGMGAAGTPNILGGLY